MPPSSTCLPKFNPTSPIILPLKPSSPRSPPNSHAHSPRNAAYSRPNSFRSVTTPTSVTEPLENQPSIYQPSIYKNDEQQLDDEAMLVPSNSINNIPTVSGDWQDTAKLIGSIIQKPTMKEKHLKRPPFRFVFDIVINIMNKTGFLSGLFSGHELESKLMSTDVSLKLNWYKKLVTAVGFFWNTKLKVEPENMIAGKKCKNTLRLLQVIALGAQSGRDCKHAVLRTLELDKDRVETDTI